MTPFRLETPCAGVYGRPGALMGLRGLPSPVVFDVSACAELVSAPFQRGSSRATGKATMQPWSRPTAVRQRSAVNGTVRARAIRAVIVQASALRATDARNDRRGQAASTARRRRAR